MQTFEKKHTASLTPFPIELIPFEPVDGPANQYGQLNQPIPKNPFVSAGIKGVMPIQPYKLPVNFLATESSAFHWPSLAELNDKLFPFPWRSGEDCPDSVLFTDNKYIATLYTGPPPTPPTPPSVTIPSVPDLTASIINSKDRLFFIAWNYSGTSLQEWHLVQVAFTGSTKLCPLCLQDGKFLVDFQHFWLQYHNQHDILHPSSQVKCHFVCPSSTS